MESVILERIFDGSIKPRDVKLYALESITENFSKERIIGEGGFGTVYKGVLRNGEIAVKRIRNNQTIDEKLFRREVNSLLKVNHKNIARFIGFCSHTEHKAFEHEGLGEFVLAEDRERLLCFEYINNGSLEKYIADELRGLQWDTRYSIIKGICEGLQYLHMKKSIIHMDLKPANILIDHNMVAKITDFGLSRMVENSQTKSTDRYLSLGYTAPEYIESGTMTVKYDVYSLGIIIIELVTGKRSIPDSNNVIRRWRHRWHKSRKETPFRYQQIAKLIEIGLLCQEKDPYKRPLISDIIRVLNELESTDSQINNANESRVGLISPYPEDDMLGIEPLVLRFPIELNTEISTSLEITNETNDFFAFIIQTTSPLPYSIHPNRHIVAPRSKYSVNITLELLDHAPQDTQYTGDFIVRSTKVNENLVSEDITEDIFNREDGKIIDEVNITIAYKAEVPPVDVSLGSLIITDTRNLHGPQESNVSQTKEESKIIASTSDELIQFDPPELCFPLVPDKKVLSAVKIINITDFYVSFTLTFSKTNTANYSQNDSESILPPRSTRSLTITREEKQNAVKDTSFNDDVFVWYAIVAEDTNASELDSKDYTEWKNLPIVLTNISSITSDELIQLDPAELCMPHWPKKAILFIINVLNTTDFYVAFNVYTIGRNAVRHKQSWETGILPPRSTERCILYWIIGEEEPPEDYFVWNRVVTEGVESGDIVGYMVDEESKKLPFIINKVSPCPSNELIHFDPPELSLPFVPNKPAVFSVNIVNNTDYCVGFKRYHPKTNVGAYYIVPTRGVMPPGSTQRLVVIRVPKNKEREDMQCQDKFCLYTCLVSEAVEDSDIFKYINCRGYEELPIIYKKSAGVAWSRGFDFFSWRSKTSLCASDELVHFDPPQLSFPFFPNKRVSMFCFFKIVNVTNHDVGFNILVKKYNSADYKIEPDAGILPPHSTQSIKVRRTPKKEEQEDMQCNDMITVWTGIVTQGVQVSDLLTYSNSEDKELSVVLTKPGESSSR